MYSPDEIQNIRNEMNRDAMPTAEELAEAARDDMRTSGCYAEGCDVNDPDVLMKDMPLDPHDCSGYQQPPMPEPRYACADHKLTREEKLARQRQREQEQATQSGLPHVRFECRITETATDPNDDVPEGAPRAYRSPPEIPTECARCGARVEEIIYPDEEGQS